MLALQINRQAQLGISPQCLATALASVGIVSATSGLSGGNRVRMNIPSSDPVVLYYYSASGLA